MDDNRPTGDMLRVPVVYPAPGGVGSDCSWCGALPGPRVPILDRAHIDSHAAEAEAREWAEMRARRATAQQWADLVNYGESPIMWAARAAASGMASGSRLAERIRMASPDAYWTGQ